jgi:ubiquinone biosynthesis protein COQ9
MPQRPRCSTHWITTDLAALRTHERVAAGLKSWLNALDTHKSAVRKAAGLGLLPWGAGAAARRVWSVSDAIWMVAGDTATDYNRQTKRALLSAVIPSTVLYWLDHDDEDALDAFITRRLQQAMKVGQVGGQLIGPALDFVQGLIAKRPKRDL